jgi:hypothetical protein
MDGVRTFNEKQKSAIRWLASKSGLYLDRRAVIENTQLSSAEYGHLLRYLNQRKCVEIVPVDNGVFASDFHVASSIDDVVREIDSPQQNDHRASEVERAMDVLISWSKRQSRDLATALYGWLPTALPGIKPWMSDKDIAKGTEWFRELQGFLATAKRCIIVVTEENVRSAWLYYEAGAIAGKGDDVRICPYLVGVKPGSLADGPFGQLQCTEAIKEDTFELLKSLNAALTTRPPHDERLLRANFDRHWPAIENELARVTALPVQEPSDFVSADADERDELELSSEAMTILVEASKHQQPAVLFSQRGVQVNGVILNESGSPRSFAAFKAGVAELVAHDLLEPRGSKGDVFAVTHAGFQYVDKASK